jgi:SAM-dependent methyltransferase
MVEYRVRDELAEAERVRLGHLTTLADRKTAGTLARLGVTAGWACLEVGAGNGSMARWLAGQVGPTGRVLATDVDDRFVGAADEGNLAFRVHDITTGAPEDVAFDLAHARAVLEHIPARDQALANLVAATKPGGLVVVEDIDWHHFDAQPLPEPFATVHFALRRAAVEGYGYDPYFGGRLHLALRDAGLVDVEVRGRVFMMRGGTPSAEWYVGAIANAAPGLVASGAVSQADADAAIAQARDPSFAVQSQVSNAAWGRVPG